VSDPLADSIVGDLASFFQLVMFIMWVKSTIAIIIAFVYHCVLSKAQEDSRYFRVVKTICHYFNLVFLCFIFVALIADVAMGATISRRPYNDAITNMAHTYYSGPGAAQWNLRNQTQNSNDCCFYRNVTSPIVADYNTTTPEFDRPTEQDCPSNWQSVCTASECSGPGCTASTQTPCNCMDIVISTSQSNVYQAWSVAYAAFGTCVGVYLLTGSVDIAAE